MIENVDNTLIISSRTKAYMEEFLTLTNYDQSHFSFNATVPMPEDFKENMLDEKDWFNWSLKNWGVKSDAMQSKTERICDTIMRIYFVSPANSPLKWLVPILNSSCSKTSLTRLSQ